MGVAMDELLEEDGGYGLNWRGFEEGGAVIEYDEGGDELGQSDLLSGMAIVCSQTPSSSPTSVLSGE